MPFPRVRPDRAFTIEKSFGGSLGHLHPTTAPFERVLGQIPGVTPGLQTGYKRLDPEIERMLTEKPKGFTLDAYFDKPISHARAVVAGLGFTPVLETTLAKAIQQLVSSAPNELVLRQTLMEKMLHDGYPFEARQLIFKRSLSLFRNMLQKSGQPEIFQPEELRPDRYPRYRRPTEKTREKQLRREMGLQKAGEGSRGGVVVGHTASGKPVYKVQSKNRSAQKKRLQLGHLDTVAQSNSKHPHVERAKEEIPHIHSHLKEGKRLTDAHKETVLQALEAIRDEAKKSLQKADPRGGKYHKRVTQKGKHRYYYDEEKYKAQHGEHVAGAEAMHKYLGSQVAKCIDKAGEGGCEIKAFKALVQKYGHQAVHDAVSGMVGKSVKFANGRFYRQTEEKAEKTEKGFTEALVASMDKLPGGRADKKQPKDFDAKQLAIGTAHELEHTKDRKLAREIAMDHLAEDLAYYTKLKRIEKAERFVIAEP